MNELLKIVADNPALFDAVKATVLKEFELDYTNMPVGVDHRQLGEIVSARLEGRRLVEEAFAEIARCKSIPPKPDARNEAR